MKVMQLLALGFYLFSCQSINKDSDTKDADGSFKTTIEVDRSTDSGWTVTYKFSEPVSKIYFSNSRLLALLDHIEVKTQGASFSVESGRPVINATNVDEITIHHRDLLLEAPFANEMLYQMTNGDTILYTGYYDVYAADTDSSEGINEIDYTFKSDASERIWVLGKPNINTANWKATLGKREAFVYFGNLNETTFASGFNLIADPNLPLWVKSLVEEGNSLDKFVQYYQSKLFKLDYFPAIYFSYSFPQKEEFLYIGPEWKPVLDSDGNPVKQKQLLSGRVLDGARSAVINIGGKIFQNHDPAFEFYINYALLGHEVVHIWNAENINYDSDHSWLWEGSAEIFTYLGLVNLQIADKIHTDSKRKDRFVYCLEKLQDSYLDDPNSTKFRESSGFEYGCGFMFNYLIHLSAKKSPEIYDAFGFWSPLLKASYFNNKKIDVPLFKQNVAKLKDAQTINKTIDKYLGQSIDKPAAKGRSIFSALKVLETKSPNGSYWFFYLEKLVDECWERVDWEELVCVPEQGEDP